VKEQNILNDDFLKKLAKEYVIKTGEIYKSENAAITPAPTPTMDAKMKAAHRRNKNGISKFTAHKKFSKRAIVSVAASIVVLVVVGVALLPEFLNHTENEVSDFYFANDAAMPAPVADMAGADDAAPMEPPVTTMPSAPEVAAEVEQDMPDFWDNEEVEMDLAFQLAPAPAGAGQVSLAPPPGWQILHIDFDGDMTIFHLEGEAQNLVVVTAATPPTENDFSDFFPVLINDTWAHMRIESTHSVLIYQLDGVQFTLTTAYSYQYLIGLAQNWV